MPYAYSELYLDDAMQTLAETFSYVTNAEQADKLFKHFIESGIAYQFGKGNPHYINMPSNALFYEIVGDTMQLVKPNCYERSPEYWCGYVLAYYQWRTGLTFEEISKKLSPSKILEMYYPLHEASLEKFVEVIN